MEPPPYPYVPDATVDARNNHAKLAIVTAGDVDARIPVVVVDEVSLPVFAILECLVDWGGLDMAVGEGHVERPAVTVVVLTAVDDVVRVGDNCCSPAVVVVGPAAAVALKRCAVDDVDVNG